MTNFDDDTTSKIFAAVDKVKNEGINKDAAVYVMTDDGWVNLSDINKLAIEYLTKIANMKDGQNYIELDEHVRMTVQFYAKECLDKIQGATNDNNKT